MEVLKKINFCGVDVNFNISAAVPIQYRNLYHEDLFKLFQDFASCADDDGKIKTEEIPPNLLEKIDNTIYVQALLGKNENTEDELTFFSQFNYPSYMAQMLEPFTALLVAQKPQKKSTVVSQKGK